MRFPMSLMLVALFVFPACSDRDIGNLQSSENALSDGRVWTRLNTVAPEKLRRELEKELDVDVTGSHHRLGFVDILAKPGVRDRLVAKYSDRINSTRALDVRAQARALSDYHDPAEMSAYMDQVVAAHPDIAMKVTLQTGLPEGGTIYAMKISDNVNVDEDEPTYLMDGQIHAREVMTAEVMMDAMGYLTDNYGTDPRVTRWVNEMEIWIIPEVNPDGSTYVFTTDNWWRKNRSHECGSDVGVDLNRNFEWNYRACDGSDDYCSSEVYHGSSAASEMETQTLSALQQELRPMYYINYHSYGEYIMWSSGCGVTDEEALLRSVGSASNDIVENDNGETGQWQIGASGDAIYHAPGGADDNAYGAAGAVAFTFELNSGGFQPDYSTWRDTTVARQRVAWGYLLDQTLDGPAVTGHTYDANTLQPVVATYVFANRPFSSGQWPLQTDAGGRFGRASLPNTEHIMVFSAPGYLPETRDVMVGSSPADVDVPMTAGTNHAPSADAGADQIVSEGDTVQLDASGSSDPDGNTLFFTWTQTAGPAVSMVNQWSATPSFFAPGVNADTVLTFQVVASDGELDSAPDTVNITVRDMWNDQAVYDSSDTPMDIPDDDLTGITSIIHVNEDKAILSAMVHVDITHTYIGDLHVTVTSPAGTEVVLHDGEGGSDNDLVADYDLPQVSGEQAMGDWVLFVYDDAASDVGTLNSWSLTLELVGDPGCQSASDCDLPNVDQHACTDGRCEIVTCDTDWADCDGSANNGCEIDTTSDVDNCGACDSPCVFHNAGASCSAGMCVMGQCDPNWADCNTDTADGCEVDTTSDPANCGGCGSTCSLEHATAGCQAGSCVVESCDDLWANCNSDASDGCEADVSTDMDNCGACGNTCQLANASAICVAGACQVDTCDGTFSDCDGSPANGCERDLDSDIQNCGACDNDCHAMNAEVSCEAGTCVMGDCLDGYGDCNTDAGDGCEVVFASDPDNCGACGLSCEQAHAIAQCLLGQCSISQCDDGYGDCNSDASDGCESDLNSDPLHCGSCGQQCDIAHAQAGCDSGQCVVAQCDDAFGDCNSDPSDGCETYLNNDMENCGACGAVCQLPHADAVCRSGSCTTDSCDEGYGNCNRDIADGCEAELSSDAENCGDCGHACEYENAGGVCSSGACSMGECAEGYADCNLDDSDGCEVDLESDTRNCGKCAHECDSGMECTDGECSQPCEDSDNDTFLSSTCGGDDCDDTNPDVHPGAQEVCNGRDDNCDGNIDEDLECSSGCGCSANPNAGAGTMLPFALFVLLGLRRRRR